MLNKASLVKTASTLSAFSQKIKSAQDEQVLTPEAVQDIAIEIAEVAEVASELAKEIVENVPTNETSEMTEEITEEPKQIEVAQDDNEEEDKDKMKLKEQVATLTDDLNKIKREAKLDQLASKYASYFPKNIQEAAIAKIATSLDSLEVIEAKIQEAKDLMTDGTMIKIASQTNSIFDLESDSEEVNIANKI